MIYGRAVIVDLCGVLHNDDEDAACVSSSDDDLSEHRLLDVRRSFALFRRVQNHSDGTQCW